MFMPHSYRQVKARSIFFKPSVVSLIFDDYIYYGRSIFSLLPSWAVTKQLINRKVIEESIPKDLKKTWTKWVSNSSIETINSLGIAR